MPPAPTKTDGFAITSMVLGIIAILTCIYGIILGVLAVIFGHVSLSKINKDPTLGGKGMAVAGLACGYVACVISIVMMIMAAVAVSAAQEGATQIEKAMNKAIKEQQELQQQQQNN